MSATTQTATVQVKRFIKAPRERVFQAWTTPNQIHHWFGSPECQVVDAEIDLRVGGSYRFKIGKGSGEMSVVGEYKTVNPPAKLAFTWKWEDDEDWENVDSVVVVDLLEKDGGTEVVISHDGFPGAESAGRHDYGWNASLEKIEAYLAAGE